MGSIDSRKVRRDGWTVERQLAFLDMLARTGSVTTAADVVGMSRESAYRLRKRASAALFAAQWDRALAARQPLAAGRRPAPRGDRKGHGGSPAERRFAALLAALKARESAEGHERVERDDPPIAAV